MKIYMKQVIVFLFFCFFLLNCSRIGFHKGKGARDFVTDYHSDSTPAECDENKTDCTKGEVTPFLQGRYEDKPGHITEYFKISTRDNLELLLVIDSSQSMDDNLGQIGGHLESFLSYISDKDWRMVFTTADHGDHKKGATTSERWEDYQGDLPRFGKLMKLEKAGVILSQFVLNRSASEYEDIFKDTLSRQHSECELPPYCHGNNEQPLRALKAAISRYKTDPENRKFFQPDTDTVALIITDEDERGNDSENATTAEEVIQTYEQIFKRQKKRLFGFSISIQDEECYKKETEHFITASYGNIVGRLAELTGGYNVSLCSQDYGAALAGISKMTKSLVQSLVLQEIFYIPETVEVSLFPSQPHVSWKLYGRKLVFSDDIQPETQVKVSYQYER